MPPTAAISSTLCTPSRVSIWIMIVTCSFADLRYSAALIPHTPCVNGLPKPRLPAGGKRLSETISLALAASETCGTNFLSFITKFSFSLSPPSELIHKSRTTYHRHKNAARTGVERILDLPRRTGARARGRDTHERARSAAPNSRDRLDRLCRPRLERGEPVLAVDHDPRQVGARLRDRPSVDHTWEGDPCPKGGLGGFEGLCESVSGHEQVRWW